MSRKSRSGAWLLAIAMTLVLAGTGLAHDEPTADGGVPINVGGDAKHDHSAQHGGPDGHLDASVENVRLVGRMNINQDQEGRVADVGVLGHYAYVAAWAAPRCQKGGVYVFDIEDPTKPKQINFIRTANDSYAGEGIQAIHISTAAFTGDILAFNNETCSDNAGNTSKHAIGGATFVDVTNPKVHKYLARGVGDRSDGRMGAQVLPRAHEIHSVFVWEDEQGTETHADDKAYAVLVDNEESFDVDILDITDPRAPQLIAEYDLNIDFPEIVQPELGTAESFLHDMIVKEIDGTQVMLLSYWDGGYVQLNVDDPTDPVYIVDSDFDVPDPLLEERTGAELPPEGNGHQAEFSKDNDYVVATDEDFDPYKPFLSVNGSAAQPFSAGVASAGVPFDTDDTMSGPTSFLGLGCSALPAAATTDQIAVVERGVCAFQAKIDNAIAAGYAGIVVFNNTSGSPACEGLLNMLATSSIPAFFVSRSVGYEILAVPGYDPANCPAGTNPELPTTGTAGGSIHISFQFDGWGYVHLFDAATMEDLDLYAVPEAHDPVYASGFGDLSVHEVAMSHQENDLAYFAYYSAGFRVARIIDDKLVEVGHFIDEGGNNFWGVEVWQHDGKEYILASDRDYGVYIFEYTGPGSPNGG